MKIKVVHVPCIKTPIAACPGFAKKKLADFKLDLSARCGFGCLYCSSDETKYMRTHREQFAALTEEQLGRRILPKEDPSLMFVWPDIPERLDNQLSGKSKRFGAGSTLVFSMLTDGFSPAMLGRELPRPGLFDPAGMPVLPPHETVAGRAVLRVIDRTSFRIRVLTKNAIVGTEPWIDFFAQHRDRFVIGLSTGTLNDSWARRIELGTSLPTERLAALANLQAAGLATFGMLCPVFPDVLGGNSLESMLDSISSSCVEHLWAEPFNDRNNWQAVRKGYSTESFGYSWLTDVFEYRRTAIWSRYATELYVRLRTKAEREGWLSKLRFLLYEGLITPEDAPRFSGLEAVLLQSKPDENGKSRNPHIAALQLGEPEANTRSGNYLRQSEMMPRAPHDMCHLGQGR